MVRLKQTKTSRNSGVNVGCTKRQQVSGACMEAVELQAGVQNCIAASVSPRMKIWTQVP